MYNMYTCVLSDNLRKLYIRKTIHQRWIKLGSIIISDFWKPYDVLNELEYTHCKVNHSVEYVNEDGDHIPTRLSGILRG